ncbi:MAG: alpha/beta hydrolase fold domain-containing protein [PS1 clade bacterium]|nr:alpha/beta hydrolase fold domain-containing protein [PS1 clade bacterium]
MCRHIACAIAGDSAGGGLALALLQHLRAHNRPQPAAAVLYSPLLDLTFSGDSFEANRRREVLFKPAAYRRAAEYYAVGVANNDARVSPLFGRFDGLAPLQVHASKTEVLYADAQRLAVAAKAAHVPVEFHAASGLVHAWPAFYPAFPEAAQTIDQSVKFLLHHWAS